MQHLTHQKSEIISPIETQFGYHIIYIRDSRFDKEGEKEILASHILFKIEPSPETLKNLKKRGYSIQLRRSG